MNDRFDVGGAREQLGRLRREIGRRIVGHDHLVDGILACLLASGHVLLEGVPGLGKTMLVKTLSDALHLACLLMLSRRFADQNTNAHYTLMVGGRHGPSVFAS